VLGGALLSLPAAWAFAGHIRRLMAEADAKSGQITRPPV